MTTQHAARPASNPAGTSDDTDAFVTALLTASRALVAVSARSLAHVEDAVTLPQFRALVVLDNHPGINLNTLSQELDVKPSTAMRMVDRLITAEMVTREANPANRREVILNLAPHGRTLVRDVTKKRRQQLHKIVNVMPVTQRAALIEALQSFAAAAGEPTPLGIHNY